ncbi:phage baseplate assembly protein V [Moraxella sp. ZY210820]|uniref:phage baseplate assembly protein V n=1 Tax=unclassified Moraxella TaxID=2685852 RepID=UPI00272F723A|nr:phage baseplate assembly protein V [Moraxella sp. ZY210820]WLF84499.1 phage baseplate assembly protein V [Moraxella sp. ZY210820]
MNLAQHHAELDRLVHNLAVIGRVIAVQNGKARFEIGDNQTDWLTIPSMACGVLSIWRSPSVGEQFLLISSSGDFNNAVPVVAIPSQIFPMPSLNPDEIKIKFPAGEMTLNQQSGVADLQLSELNITADVNVTGTITASGDVVAGGISLQQHTHGGVKNGGGSTGVAQ